MAAEHHALTLMAADQSESESERQALRRLRAGWRLVPPSPSGKRREERVRHLLDVIETAADELYADHTAPEWTCPACHQIARIKRRTVRTTAYYVSLISDGSAHLNHREDQCGMESYG